LIDNKTDSKMTAEGTVGAPTCSLFFLFVYRISDTDEMVSNSLHDANSTKHLNLALMSYGADVTVDYIGRFVAGLSADVRQLVDKMRETM
jgi:hypothetical protein